MWMNAWEIDEIVEFTETKAQQYAPYARYLRDWRDTVDSNSDGWAHWRGGSKPADKLSDLLNEVKMAYLGRGEYPDEALFPKALSPIKAAATKHKFEAPTLDIPNAGQSKSLGM